MSLACYPTQKRKRSSNGAERLGCCSGCSGVDEEPRRQIFHSPEPETQNGSRVRLLETRFSSRSIGLCKKRLLRGVYRAAGGEHESEMGREKERRAAANGSVVYVRGECLGEDGRRWEDVGNNNKIRRSQG